ncbi:hypothetical protein RF55_22549 [Lasius niger]|uniref:Uncharacterized protein n=1 Tax=Lasius niger TaxID=67767 RepID=A0A0J7JWW6_LASNI|nr:hypothetical protein RF55_22549 [Lasius niger]
MPVYHHLMWTPELLGEEYQGPIDGVRPLDYPETYGYLTELRCVMIAENRLYQSYFDSHKICQACYATASEEQKSEYGIVAPHCLVHKNSANCQTGCTFCNKCIITIKPAHECSGCIEKYLHTSKAYFDEGWGAPVFDRRAEE